MNRLVIFVVAALAISTPFDGAIADQVTGLTVFSSGTPAYSASVNANFAEIKNSVDDNNTRIQALENGSSVIGTGRIFLPLGDGLGYQTLPDSATGAWEWKMTPPADYVSQGADDVVYTAIFHGGDNCSFQIALVSGDQSFGASSLSNTVSPAAGAYQTLAVPDIANSGIPQPIYISNPSSTRTGFGDITWFRIYRNGNHGSDTCTGAMFIYGITVEYPRGN